MKRRDNSLTVMARITEEFLDEIRNCQQSEAALLVKKFAAKYPEFESQITSLLPALINLEEIADKEIKGKDLHSGAGDSTARLTKLADYEIIRQIGKGGMGVVYEAHQKSLNRRVALKTLTLDIENHPDFLERFQREAQTAAGLHHSNIVPVYDVGFENGIHYFSMQFIDGINLSDLCRQVSETIVESNRISGNTETITIADATASRTKVSITSNQSDSDLPKTPSGSSTTFRNRKGWEHHRQVANIGAQIASALQHIHSLGIVHRDIKPSNILLDESGNAWLADWGLVKSEVSDLTQTGDLFGSMPYMAPERFSGKAEPASDVYSLGATLYELLTMCRVFHVDDRVEMIRLIVDEQPKRPRSIEPSISEDFENVILKAIEKRPEMRYSTAQDFANDLENIMAGRPVSARRITAIEHIARWCKRYPYYAALLTLFVVSLVAGTVTSSIFAFQANQASQLANERQKQSQVLAIQNEESLDVFFGTFFPLASPDKGAKMPAEVREMMDQAVDEIIKQEQYDAVVVGKLFNKLGWVYFNQQDYQSALRVFQHSVDRVTDDYGENHEVAMTALDHVGMTLMRLEKHEDAKAALLKAFMLQAKTLGADHENTIHSYAKLGDLYNKTGDFEEAIRITKQVLEIRKRPNRNDNAFVSVSMNGLALSYLQKQEPEKAIELLESVIKQKEERNQIDLGVGYNLHNLARAYRQLEDFEKAKELNDRSLQIRRKELADDSPSILACRILAAGIESDAGRSQKALTLLEKLSNEVSEAKHPFIAGMTFLELGLCLKKLNRNQEAYAHLKKAQEILTAYRTKNHLSSRTAMAALKDLKQSLAR